MDLSKNLAKHLRELHVGGNWTCINFKDVLSSITIDAANTKLDDVNTIIALTYHVHYYIDSILKVLKGGPLDSKDIYSFDHPPITTEVEWNAMKGNLLMDAELLAQQIELLPKEVLDGVYVDKKYGSYHRNLLGLIEHSHYHLGQIVILKKLILAHNA